MHKSVLIEFHSDSIPSFSCLRSHVDDLPGRHDKG
jgi:hypothetical protein